MSQDKETIEVVIDPVVKTKDIFLRIKKKIRGPSLNLEPVRQPLTMRDEDDDVPISRFKPQRMKDTTPHHLFLLKFLLEIQKEKVEQHLLQI